MDCIYESVVIIGYGQIVNNCIQKLTELRSKFGYNLEYIEYENTGLSNSTDICEKCDVSYKQLGDKEKVTEYFLGILEKTLVISAGNFYIFPKGVVEKENLTIINFHSALLPKYPGRNAQSWAIFCEEKEAGATWHYVTDQLDAGKYIIQKACEITGDTKAYELTGKIMRIAFEGFWEIIEGVLVDAYDRTQNVVIDPNRKVYKGKDIPGEGRFTLEDDPEYIYRLLRSTDYGKSDIFPAIRTNVKGKEVRISSYKKLYNEGISGIVIDDKMVLIPFDAESVLRLKYKEI